MDEELDCDCLKCRKESKLDNHCQCDKCMYGEDTYVDDQAVS